jgi:hypothetical protein
VGLLPGITIDGFYPYSNKELRRSRLYFVTQYFEGDRLSQRTMNFYPGQTSYLRHLKDFSSEG